MLGQLSGARCKSRADPSAPLGGDVGTNAGKMAPSPARRKPVTALRTRGNARLHVNAFWAAVSVLPRGGDAAVSMLLSAFRAGAAHVVLFGLIGSHINGDQHTQ
jgi:hypothetical protein